MTAQLTQQELAKMREGEPWGSYLDKDLVCQSCNHVVDTWDC